MTKNVTDKTNTHKKQILIYGIGNPGRQDDALGVLLADKVQSWIEQNSYQHIQTDQNYQLNIEDADRISEFDVVVFVDASVLDISSVLMEEVIPNMKTDFSMHSVEPSFVVGLCQQIFKRTPSCYQLHIKAYSFEFMKPLTKEAEKNLQIAFEELENFILKFKI